MPARSNAPPAATLLAALAFVVGACVAPAPEQTQADPEGELRTRIPIEPASIDPQVDSSILGLSIAMSVFEPLLTFDPKTLRPIPAAARELPTASADGLSYTFRLRDGLSYSDGSPVRASDFAYGFSRLCDPAVKGYYASSGSIVAGCREWQRLDPKKDSPAALKAARDRLFAEGIKVLGEKELQFMLVEPAPYFLSVAALWLTAPVRESDVLRGGENWTEPQTYVGNGPFILSEWKHGERLVLTANPRYRNPPKIKKWTRVIIENPDIAFTAYRNGELDYLLIGPEDLPTVERDADLQRQVVDAEGSCTNFISFNQRRPPFDDHNVRLAFAKSLDREAFTRDIAKINKPASAGFIPPGLPGYDPGDTAQRFEPAIAKQLLERSRYAGREELRTIRWPYVKDPSGRFETRLAWFQQQWKTHLGVEILLDEVEREAVRQLFRRAETTPQLFGINGWCADYPDQQDWLSVVFASDSSFVAVRYTGYKSEEFDRLVKQADRESDPKRRDELYLKASRLLSGDAPVAWLVYPARKYLKKPWVQGIVDTALDLFPGFFRMTEIYVTKKR